MRSSDKRFVSVVIRTRSPLAARCRIAGASFTELVPDRDVNERSALVVVRLVMRLIAGIARR